MSVSSIRPFPRSVPRSVAGTGRWIARRAAECSVILLICISITAPPIRLGNNLPFVKAEQLLLAVVCLVYVWFLLAGYARAIRFNGMFVIGALYCFCVTLSGWYGAHLLGHPVVLRDLYEIPKALFPVVFFTVAYEAELSEGSLRRLTTFFSIAVVMVCFYAWAQFAGLGVTHTLNPYYTAGEHIDVILLRIGRVYSTMGNPNVLGQLMSWAIPAFMMAALFGVGNRMWNIVVVFCCLITLAMAASRYGVVTSTLGIAMIFVVSPLFLRRRLGRLALLILLLPAFALTVQSVAVTNPNASERLLTLKDPLHTDSARGRLDALWPDAETDFARSPFVGNGPAKTYFSDIITDSEYLDVLKEFGVVGFLPYLAYYALPLFLIGKGLKSSRRLGAWAEDRMPATSLVMRLSLVLIVLAMVMNVGESTFYNLLTQGFLWLWIGLGARASKTLNEWSTVAHHQRA